MMRIAPAAKAFVYARASFPSQRNVAFTALRMMATAAPSVKVSPSASFDGHLELAFFPRLYYRSTFIVI
jgi:hypothetical protein